MKGVSEALLRYYLIPDGSPFAAVTAGLSLNNLAGRSLRRSLFRTSESG
jgi:hypothetical protein